MPDPRPVLVVNPAGAAGRLGRGWPRLAAAVRRELGDFREALTAAPMDAVRLTREAITGGAPLVVAVGGDGTVNEVVNGFFSPDGHVLDPAAAIGLLPCGTGGDFRRTFGLGKDLVENARRLRAGTDRPLDVGRATFTAPDGTEQTRCFANIASFGMSGEVVKEVNEGSKLLGGRLTFKLATVRALLTYRNPRVRLCVDGGPADDRLINTVAVCNGRFFGGGMHIGPRARPDDGLLDLVVVGDVGLLFFARHQGHLYRGRLEGVPRVTREPAARVRAEPLGEAAVRIDLDGESVGRLPATFEVLPGAIRVRA